ncbi:MAG TPA: hypothetical protein PLJ27_09320 [Polyangiaceae bacterium]|nr:hypothetical protein [Polyangiaceae bacterium]HQB44922.1 hypothetical protein [Polyangiaceae bacterium]HQK17644.1 hypothetical protein [Polyangiaceae bacterium]HQM09818.1 hypothetical protein [Polyangiaceae bacterium]
MLPRKASTEVMRQAQWILVGWIQEPVGRKQRILEPMRQAVASIVSRASRTSVSEWAIRQS